MTFINLRTRNGNRSVFMALPKQVQDALDAADATLAQANGQQPNPPESPPALTQDDPPATAPVQQAPPQPTAAPAAPSQTPPTDTWEARYRSLQGMFNKTVPELQGQVKVLQGELSTAIDRLNQASTKLETQPEPQRQADPKDVDTFGADMVDFVSRIVGSAIGKATQMFDAKVALFENDLHQLKQTQQGTTQQLALSAEQMFFNDVTKAIPNWEAINIDPRFIAWLNEIDPVYGAPRQAALAQAQRTLNADHAASVFRTYINLQTPEPPKGPDPLEQQVTPRGSATVAPTPEEKPIFTEAQVTEFYNNVRKGMYRGQEAEATRIEQIINTALSEGRVR